MNDDVILPSSHQPQRLGTVVGGSLTRGLEVKLEGGAAVEDVAVGRYVIIQGERQRFFGIITDVELKAVNDAFKTAPPATSDDFSRQVIQGTAAYGSLRVTPYLRIGPTADAPPEPAKTVPPHFAPVWEASQEDVALIFGQEDASHFIIGSPLDMDVKVCLDHERFVERSNGVFGKSGTGKTYLTYILLANIIQKSLAQPERARRAVNLVFDMHNEYGWRGKSEDRSREPKGLKQLFPSQVAVFTLDEENARRRGVPYDAVVEIAYGDIEPEDIAVLRETLNLSDRAVEAAHELSRHFGRRDWIPQTLALASDADQRKQLRGELSVHEETFSNLLRGLRRLTRHAFLREKTLANSLRDILGHLLGGKNVVLEFGRYGNDLAAYMLVANVLSRRIYDTYRERSEAASSTSEEPLHLVITIEEAHKFLNPQVASQTIFGTIAREMRKYNVTLLVIDQRPGAIDGEVLSQLGTKIACLLDNDRDVDAVLEGVAGRTELRSVLARLDSRQQALIFGHAVPMPVVVQTEEYGEAFYQRLAAAQVPSLSQQLLGDDYDPADDLYPPPS